VTAPADDSAAEGEQAAGVSAAGQDGVDSATTLAAVGLVVGVVGVLLALFAVVRGCRAT
jgi:hypothetical protein